MSGQRFKRLAIYKFVDKNVGVLSVESGDKHS
jgi:hypothetical protein